MEIRTHTVAPLGWYLVCTSIWPILACVAVEGVAILFGYTLSAVARLAFGVGLIIQYLAVSRRFRR